MTLVRAAFAALAALDPTDRRRLRAILAAALVIGAAVAGPSAGWAQQAAAANATAPPQLQLNEAHISRYIAVGRELVELANKLKAAGTPAPAILDAQERERDAIARKHGAESGAEHQAIDFSIWLVVAGLDRETGEYADPIPALRQQIAATETDKALDDAKKALEDAKKELEAAKKPQ